MAAPEPAAPAAPPARAAPPALPSVSSFLSSRGDSHMQAGLRPTGYRGGDGGKVGMSASCSPSPACRVAVWWVFTRASCLPPSLGGLRACGQRGTAWVLFHPEGPLRSPNHPRGNVDS